MASGGAVECLTVAGLHAFYGESHILHGMDFRVGRGELVTLLGRNGAGRTTTIKAILGLVEKRSGSIMLNGREIVEWPPHRIARLGVGYCPEDRGIFSSLSAEENLRLPPKVTSEGMSDEEIYALFPNLKEQRGVRGNLLSGGEQQMLALARILRAGARLLLLDEISEGLAPVIVKRLSEVILQLRQKEFTIIMAEQNFHFAASLADRMYVIERGHVVAEIGKDEVEGNRQLLRELLGV
ncbi:MAG TPA: ABC transporter ATP-binding protein [Vicinamibacteria bacterium]|nr:ABC transporter ATP-binding protein [Vicinamibacteria bacterium]